MVLQHIPEAVILSCKDCGHVWIQTRGYALMNPMEISRCPRCKVPWHPHEESRHDPD